MEGFRAAPISTTVRCDDFSVDIQCKQLERRGHIDGFRASIDDKFPMISALRFTILLAVLAITVVLGPVFRGGTFSPRYFQLRHVFLHLGFSLPFSTCQATPADARSIQTCISNAARGDTVSIPVANNNLSTAITLPAKSGSFDGSNYITIQSAKVGSLASRRMGGRLGELLSSDEANMPTLTVTASSTPVFSFDSGATGYKFIGLHLTNNLIINSSSDITNSFVNTNSASDVVFDRCVVHPKEHPSVMSDYLGSAAYAFSVNGNSITVQRSYIYDFFGRDGTDFKLKGVVSAQSVKGISNTSPAVITCASACGVSTGDTVQVEFAGGGLEGFFRPGGSLTGDFVATSVDATHFSLPINLTGADVYDTTNTRTVFYRWPRVSSVTLGNPTIITMSAAHGLANGNKVRPHGFAGTLGRAINGNDYMVTVTGSTTFAIPVNTSGLSSYSGSGGYYKAEGSGIQTIAFGIGADTSDFTATNNYVQAWYATLFTAGSDASPTVTTTVNASPTPTASDIYVATTSAITPGMLIAADTTHFDEANKCPFGGQGGDRPCFAFGVVGSVNSGTGQVHFSTALKIKNAFGSLVDPTAAILSPGQVNINGKNPTRINLYYNTLDIPFDFSAFHYVSNGNTGKGVIEGKDCTDCTAEGNIIQGFPSSFSHTAANQNGSSPWMGLFNVTIRNNWFKAFRTGILLSFVDYNARNSQGYGATITNNLFLGGVGYTGECLAMNTPANGITYTHNTCTNGYLSGQTARFTGASTLSSNAYYRNYPIASVVYRDNIVDSGKYVAQCYIDDVGHSTFTACLSSSTLTHNLFVGTFAGGANPLSLFTDRTNKTVADWKAMKFVGSDPNVLSDWALRSDSPGHTDLASDGTDRGVNINTLRTALLNNDGFSPSSP